MKLRVKEIGAVLPGGNRQPAKAPDVPVQDRTDWRDSSMDLMRGLDVIEISDDVLIVNAQAMPQEPPTSR